MDELRSFHTLFNKPFDSFYEHSTTDRCAAFNRTHYYYYQLGGEGSHLAKLKRKPRAN